MAVEQSILYPIFFKEKKDFFSKPLTVLAGDVGATKTHLGLYEFEEDRITMIAEERYLSGDFDDLALILQDFLKDRKTPDRISLGVPGPVMNGKADTTNLPWALDELIIREKSGVEHVTLMNDLKAAAYGLAGLCENDVCTLHEGSEHIKGNAAVIAPGTGLGEAGLFWDGHHYRPFATEGGHAGFAPQSETDIELFRYLRELFGRVSYERVLSGPGIINIYRFLRDVKKREEPAWLAEKLAREETAAVISRHASDPRCLICTETMDLFFRYLAEEAANLALKLKATGGVLIGGGIVPRTRHLIDRNQFRNNFLNVGRMRELSESISVKIILNDKIALLGAAYCGAYSCE